MGFLEIPAYAWFGLIGAFLFGLLFLAIAHRLKNAGFWKELLRDVGIGFLVAAVVTAVYEYSTRATERHERDRDVVDRTMESLVPRVVWYEIKDQILSKRAFRRNVDLDLKISRLPNGQAVLHMKYGYDLYGLTAGEPPIVEHELDNIMWNPQLELPRFESVVVQGPGPNDSKTYVGKELQQLHVALGKIRLDGRSRVPLPLPTSGGHVRIITERRELMYVPGSYYLILPELTVRDDGNTPTVTVEISEIPPDLAAEVTTYHAQHDFTKPDPKKNVWTFDGTLLAGQGFVITLRPRASGTSAQVGSFVIPSVSEGPGGAGGRINARFSRPLPTQVPRYARDDSLCRGS
jgi:hypothetical protein